MLVTVQRQLINCHSGSFFIKTLLSFAAIKINVFIIGDRRGYKYPSSRAKFFTL